MLDVLVLNTGYQHDIEGWDAERLTSFGSDTPLGRAKQPVELAGAYVYLASTESLYVSGSVLAVTGGNAL